jgi:hypothetical protein
MPQKKRYRGSYDKYGNWTSASEKQEEDENRRTFPKSSYGNNYRKQRTNKNKKHKTSCKKKK